MSVPAIERLLTSEGRYLFPKWVAAKIASYSFDGVRYSAKISDDFDFPGVISLEESIKANKAKLSMYLM